MPRKRSRDNIPQGYVEVIGCTNACSLRANKMCLHIIELWKNNRLNDELCANMELVSAVSCILFCRSIHETYFSFVEVHSLAWKR